MPVTPSRCASACASRQRRVEQRRRAAREDAASSARPHARAGARWLARGVADDPAAEGIGRLPVMPAAARAAVLTQAAWTSSESRYTGPAGPRPAPLRSGRRCQPLASHPCPMTQPWTGRRGGDATQRLVRVPRAGQLHPPAAQGPQGEMGVPVHEAGSDQAVGQIVDRVSRRNLAARARRRCRRPGLPSRHQIGIARACRSERQDAARARKPEGRDSEGSAE